MGVHSIFEGGTWGGLHSMMDRVHGSTEHYGGGTCGGLHSMVKGVRGST